MSNQSHILIALFFLSAATTPAMSEPIPFVDSPRPVRDIPVDFLPVTILSLSPSGHYLLMANREEVKVYDTTSGALTIAFSTKPVHNGATMSAVVGSDGETVYTYQEQAGLLKWRNGTPSAVSIPREENNPPMDLSSDAEFLSVGGRLVNLRTNNTEWYGRGTIIRFVPSAPYYFVYGSRVDKGRGAYRTTSTDNDKYWMSLYGVNSNGNTQYLRSVQRLCEDIYATHILAYDYANERLAEKTSQTWTIRTIKDQYFKRLPFESTPGQLEIRADGRFLAYNETGAAYLVNLDSEQKLEIAQYSGSHPAITRFSDDGALIAVLTFDGKKVVRLWALPRTPPYLQIRAALLDTAFNANGTLENGELASIKLDIENTGTGSAFGIEVRSETAANGVSIRGVEQVGALGPGKKLQVLVPIAGQPTLLQGEAEVRLSLKELNGFDSQALSLRIPTRVLGDCRLVLNDTLRVLDPKRPAGANATTPNAVMGGNGNGLAEPGESVMLEIPVRNSGDASAYRVSVFAKVRIDDSLLRPVVVLDSIPSGQERNARLPLVIPPYCKADSIAVAIVAFEKRGNGSKASNNYTIPFRKPQPRIDVNTVVHDGNTPQSRGNSNGLVELGEIIDLEVSLSNVGSSAASDIIVQASTGQGGMVFSKSSFSVPILPADGVKTSGRIVFAVPAGAGSGMRELTLVVQQKGWPSSSVIVGVDVKQP